MGMIRFARIGLPHPYFTAHFVGSLEIVCGLLASSASGRAPLPSRC